MTANPGTPHRDSARCAGTLRAVQILDSAMSIELPAASREEFEPDGLPQRPNCARQGRLEGGARR